MISVDGLLEYEAVVYIPLRPSVLLKGHIYNIDYYQHKPLVSTKNQLSLSRDSWGVVSFWFYFFTLLHQRATTFSKWLPREI